MKDRLISSIQDPRLLEHLYQEDPDDFIAAFQEVFPDHPDSLVLQCWQERLSYVPNTKESVPQRNEKPWITILLTFLFVLAGGFIYKIAEWLPVKYSYNIAELFHFRNAGAYFLPFMAFLYLIHTKAKKKTVWLVLAILLISAVYINLLPNVVFEGKIISYSDTLLLACFHVPLLYWFAGGFAFVGFPFRSIQKRLEFLKMNSEILFMTTLILLAGIVLTGISLASFGIIDVDAGEILYEWVVPFGAIGSPIVATVLVLKTVKLPNLPPLLAKIFAPLFLITVLAFLMLMLLKIKNPFEDRDFLIVINILLFIIMSLTTFILLDRKPHLPRNIMDIIVVSLLVACFLIDIVTVVSVFFRVVKEGFTPNRIALIGINLVLLGHLTGLLVNFIGWLARKIEYQKTVGWIGGYLPVYLGWSVLMVFIYPWLFRLR